MPAGEQRADAWVGVRPGGRGHLEREARCRGAGTVTQVVPFALGHSTLVTIRVGEHEVHAQLTRAAPP